MRAHLLLLSLFFVLVTTVGAQQRAEAKPTPAYTEANRKEAERLWELAVVAKGGRDKLRSVRSFVDVSDAKAAWSLFKTFKIHMVSVYLFPWKTWSWNDQGDSVFGLSENMYNYETGMKYFLDPRNTASVGTKYTRWETGRPVTVGVLTEFEPPDIPNKGKKMVGLVTDLLILSWTEPKILGMSTGKNIDIIHTEIEGDSKIDFEFDRKTHLPSKWRAFDDKRTNGEWLKDYKEFDGIMMPTHTGPLDESGQWTHTYEFNVDIDESIWERPSPFNLAANGWRKRN